MNYSRIMMFDDKALLEKIMHILKIATMNIWRGER